MRPERNKSFRSAITALILGGLLGVAFIGIAKAHSKDEVRRMVIEEARNSDVPVDLALAVARIESNFNDKALSPKGARGVMQIMPATAKAEFGTKAADLWEPRTNIRLGLAYLTRLYQRYGERWDLALSHYNGGGLKGKGGYAHAHGYTHNYVADVYHWRRWYRNQPVVVALAIDRGEHNVPPTRSIVDAPKEPVRKPAQAAKRRPIRPIVRERPADDDKRERPWRLSNGRWFPVATGGPGRIDDFSYNIERRRWRAKRDLDDFQPIVRLWGKE